MNSSAALYFLPERTAVQQDVVKVKIKSHNPPGEVFMTPDGTIRTNAEGVAEVTAAQLAHLKRRSGLQITTFDARPERAPQK